MGNHSKPRVKSFCAALFVFLTITDVASAQEQEVEATVRSEIEHVIAVGSRSQDQNLTTDLAVAAAVISEETLRSSGELDLGASLTKLDSSFNYSRKSIGDGALMRSGALRGLSPDQTLVLVNGKRRHNMAWVRILDGDIGYGSGGTDFAALPASAIAKIEILRDGAAAQYGSDAIAGVINAELVERNSGGDISFHYGFGDANAATTGITLQKGLTLGEEGFFTATFELFEENPIMRNGGNGGLDPNYQHELIVDSSPDIGNLYLFANSAFPINDRVEAFAFGGISKRHGLASGAYRFRYDYWEGLQSGDATWDEILPAFVNFHERNTHPVYPSGFLPYEDSTIDDNSISVGFRGTRDNGLAWDLSVTSGFNRFDFGVSNTINASIGAQYVQANPNATVSQIVANAGPTEGHSGGIEFRQTSWNLDVKRDLDRRTDRPFHAKAFAAGFEYRSERYKQIAGDQAAWSCGAPHVENFSALAVGPDGTPIDGVIAACGFQGYPGYSPLNAALSEDDRNSVGLWLEVDFKLHERNSILAAVRSENYSDAGVSLTGKVAARREMTDQLALRAAWSSGFRAPSLSQRRFNSTIFVGSEEGLTTTFSANEGHPVAVAFGVERLDHEISSSWSGGLVFSTEVLSVTFDLYHVAINDRIVRSRGLNCASVPACAAENVGTAALFFNGVDTETTGWDLAASWITRFGSASVHIDAQITQNETEIVGENAPQNALGLQFSDYFGGWTADLLENGQPKSQAFLAATWIFNDYTVTSRWNRWGESTQHPLDTGGLTIDAESTVDIEMRLQRNQVRASIGINNVADELPTKLSKTHLSNVLWGITYPTEVPIGIAGRFIYGRIGYSF